MSYASKNVKNLCMSITAVMVLAAIAIWQFYQFVNFKDAGIGDLQGGSLHLWWALAMAIFACIAGVLVFSVFLRHDTDDELHITAPPRAKTRGVKK
jgi:membrane associated rhomboid family serine protease